MMKIFLSLLVLFIFVPYFSWANVEGVMMVVKGDIKVTSGKTGKTEAAKVGRKVTEGDTITAGADSRAKIVMADKNVINISPDSKMTIAKYESSATSKNVELNVLYGKVRAGVEQKYDGEQNKFNIKTPSAVAGVRGTDFITSFNSSTRETKVVTVSGMVAVGQPGPGGQILNAVFVPPGQGTSVKSGALPDAPKPVPQQELNQMKNETAGVSNSNNNRSPASTATNGSEDRRQNNAGPPLITAHDYPTNPDGPVLPKPPGPPLFPPTTPNFNTMMPLPPPIDLTSQRTKATVSIVPH